jgi:hypothetical protein
MNTADLAESPEPCRLGQRRIARSQRWPVREDDQAAHAVDGPAIVVSRRESLKE